MRLATILCLLGLAIAPTQAQAVSRDVKDVFIASGYGVLGGVVLGAVAVPLTRDGGSFLMGISIGLYLGIVGGFYHIYHRDDPGNPLRRHSMIAPHEILARADQPLTPHRATPPQMRAEIALIRF